MRDQASLCARIANDRVVAILSHYCRRLRWRSSQCRSRLGPVALPARLHVIGVVLRAARGRAGCRAIAAKRNLPAWLDPQRLILSAQRQRALIRQSRTGLPVALRVPLHHPRPAPDHEPAGGLLRDCDFERSAGQGERAADSPENLSRAISITVSKRFTFCKALPSKRRMESKSSLQPGQAE
jgi:hypothetical protein